MAARKLSRWLMSITLAVFFLVAINLLVATTPAQGRPAAALINCSGSIQACIDAANDGDTILIAAGNYTESLTLSKAVSLTGENRDTTIIHAAASQRVLTVTGATIGNSVVISGLTITGGDVSDPLISQSYPEHCGGGIYITSEASPTLYNLNIISNTANLGGGIFDEGPILILVHANVINNVMSYEGSGIWSLYAAISDTNFISNRSSSRSSTGRAAFVYYYGTVANSRFERNQSGAAWITSAIVTNTDFISNHATSFSSLDGAGLNGQNVVIFGGRFELNVKDGPNKGGAVAVLDALYISGTQFISNSADSGGAVWAHHAAIDNAYFGGNAAIGLYYSIGGGGGAIFGEESLSVTNSRFVSNTAPFGGAILLSRTGTDPSVPARAAIINSLLVNNAATTDGAAIFAGYRTSNQITLADLTIADPNVNDKPAIAVANVTLHIIGTIIASHTIAISSTGSTVYEDYNLFFNNVTNTIGVITGVHSLIGDPRFVDPLHGDYHLQFGSAAIDNGIDAGVYTDLDGNPRPKGMGFDIGAYEYQSIRYLWLPLIRK